VTTKLFSWITTLALCSCCYATTYTYVNTQGVQSYTTPTLATPASQLANPAFHNNGTTITGLPNPTANTSAANNPRANTTAVSGQIAGALAASTAAHASGNQAAAMAAQNMLVNAEANVISTGVMGAINGVMGH